MAKGIQSVSLGFRLLRAIADSDVPVPLKSAAAAAEMSPSKARMYLISLMQAGLVAQDLQSGLYSLGPYALQLGTRALQRLSPMEVMREAMRTLQKKTQALVLLCNWQETGVVIVAVEEGNDPQPLQWRIGGTAGVSSTATGAVFLAFGPQQPVWKHLAGELKEARLSQAAVKKRTRELEATAEEVRERGFAIADPVVFAAGVTISGFAAIAVPVFGYSRQMRYVLTLLYRTDRPRNKADLIRLALQAAESGSVYSRAD